MAAAGWVSVSLSLCRAWLPPGSSVLVTQRDFGPPPPTAPGTQQAPVAPGPPQPFCPLCALQGQACSDACISQRALLLWGPLPSTSHFQNRRGLHRDTLGVMAFPLDSLLPQQLCRGQAPAPGVPGGPQPRSALRAWAGGSSQAHCLSHSEEANPRFVPLQGQQSGWTGGRAERAGCQDAGSQALDGAPTGNRRLETLRHSKQFPAARLGIITCVPEHLRAVGKTFRGARRKGLRRPGRREAGWGGGTLSILKHLVLTLVPRSSNWFLELKRQQS